MEFVIIELQLQKRNVLIEMKENGDSNSFIKTYLF